MFRSLFLALIILGACLPVIGQDRGAAIVDWRTEPIGKWGIKSLTLPAELKKETDATKAVSEKDTAGMRSELSWVIWPKGATGFPTLRVMLVTTIWDTNFPLVSNGEKASAEKLVRGHHSEYESLRSAGLNGIVEARFLEIDGLLGSFYRRDFEVANAGTRDLRSNLVWTAYRNYHKDRQSISLTVAGRHSELVTLSKIVESISFEKAIAPVMDN